LAEQYNVYYQNQPVADFHGLRDFYALVNHQMPSFVNVERSCLPRNCEKLRWPATQEQYRSDLLPLKQCSSLPLLGDARK